MAKPEVCSECAKIVTHTKIKVIWEVDTIEGKTIIAEYVFCIECGTIKLGGKLVDPEEDFRTG